MDAEAWLERQVVRALETGDPASHPELIGAVYALQSCGVISEDVAEAAKRRLREAVDASTRPAPFPAVHAPGEAPGPQRLRAILCPAAPIADVDGTAVVLLAVELWTSAVIVRIGADGDGPAFEPPPYVTSVVWAVAGEPAPLPATLSPQFWLATLPLRLADDAGTVYSETRGHGSGEPPWRFEMHFAPAVPAHVRRLTVTLSASVELELPDDR